MSPNDISLGRIGFCPADSEVDQASEDSDGSAAPSRRSKGGAKASRSKAPKLRTLNRWTPEEHDRLAYLVAKWGSEKNWAKVAEEMPGRTGKQCRERWLNHMKPGIIKGNWSFEEEFLLAQCHAVVGSHWSKMTKRLPGRTENSIKNFWNATLRSKAPHKRRGVLWLYMQQQTCQEGENVDAFLLAVARLYEAQELPACWAQLMQQGRLSERTLRAVLRAEKDYLENPDTELHPLAVPHPTHGLLAAAEADATAPPAVAAPDTADGADEQQQQPDLQARPQADTAARAPAGADASSARPPASPLPAPGLTPRFPGGEGGAGHDSGTHCSAACDGPAAVARLSLPPEVLASLGPHLWPGLLSQLPACPYSGAPGSMEPLMPSLGLTSDMHPSGHPPGGAFGGHLANGMLSSGHDSLWPCLPSIGGAAQAREACRQRGGYPGHAGDPLKLLEPYGALQGHNHHHSSSSSMQTRPDSALELEQPARQYAAPPAAAAAADGQNLSRHNSSRPGSSASMQTMLPPEGSRAGDERLPAAAVGYQQHREPGHVPGRPQVQATSARGVHTLQGGDGSHAGQQAAAAGRGSHQRGTWSAQGGSAADAGMQAAATTGYAGVHSWSSVYEQQQACRGGSPTESGTPRELVCEGGAGAGTATAFTVSGHGAGCSCSACGLREGPRGGSSSKESPGMYSQHLTKSSYQQQAAQPYTQDYPQVPAAWAAAAASHALSHQQSVQDVAAPGRALPAARQQPRSLTAAPGSRLQHQHRSTSSPFASHANDGWEGLADAAPAPAAATCEAPGSLPGAAGVTTGTAAQAGWGAAGMRLQQAPAAAQQQAQAGRQQLQLGACPGGVASVLFSPQSLDSPMTGALQHLLDSAAAQAGIRAQDICAWLATANTAHAPTQNQQQRREGPGQQQQQSCWGDAGLPASGSTQADTTRILSSVLTAHDTSSDVNTNRAAPSAAHDTSFACSILEALLGPQSAQLGDMLLSPAGLPSTAALLQGATTPTPAGALAGLQAAVVGVKRERSLPEAQEDLLIEQPGIKLPRVF